MCTPMSDKLSYTALQYINGVTVLVHYLPGVPTINIQLVSVTSITHVLPHYILGVLTAQDLHILTSILKAAAPQWKMIGDALGFLDSDLTIIQQSPLLIPEGSPGYFRQILSQWLNWAPPNHPWPTLEALEMALRRSGQENLAFQLRSLFLQQKGMNGSASFVIII